MLHYHSRSILQCKIRMFNSVSSCPCFRYHHFVTTIQTLRRGCKHHHMAKYLALLPVGITWISPLFMIMTKSVVFSQSLSTQTSPNEHQMSEEALDEILLAMKNNPSSIQGICTSYINKLVKARNLSSASRLLMILHNNHIFFSIDAYNLLLAAAGEAGNIDLVANTFKDLVVSGKSLSSKSYLNLAKAFTKTGDNLLLTKIVIEILELNSPQGATVINRVIYAFAKCREIDKALLVFDHMKDFKCKPDQITYNIVLDILGRAGRVDEMVQEFASMKEANIAPDVISYNTLINSLRKVGRLDLCLVYLKHMVEAGLEPDLRTYIALIESFGRSGNIEISLRLFGEMKQRNICPSISIYRSLINNLKKMGKLDLATTISKEMDISSSDLVSRTKRQLGT